MKSKVSRSWEIKQVYNSYEHILAICKVNSGFVSWDDCLRAWRKYNKAIVLSPRQRRIADHRDTIHSFMGNGERKRRFTKAHWVK